MGAFWDFKIRPYWLSGLELTASAHREEIVLRRERGRVMEGWEGSAKEDKSDNRYGLDLFGTQRTL